MENMCPIPREAESQCMCVHVLVHISAWPCRSANVSGLYLREWASCVESCEMFLLSVLLHFRSVAIVAKWWCQSRSIEIKATPPFFNGNHSLSKMENTVQSARPKYASPKAEQALASHTKMCLTEHTCIHGLVVLVDNHTDVCEERTEYLLTSPDPLRCRIDNGGVEVIAVLFNQWTLKNTMPKSWYHNYLLSTVFAR